MGEGAGGYSMCRLVGSSLSASNACSRVLHFFSLECTSFTEYLPDNWVDRMVWLSSSSSSFSVKSAWMEVELRHRRNMSLVGGWG